MCANLHDNCSFVRLASLVWEENVVLHMMISYLSHLVIKSLLSQLFLEVTQFPTLACTQHSLQNQKRILNECTNSCRPELAAELESSAADG